jgi:CRP/FNR family transcriptional regulator, anaerobic regulatory protein
MSQQWRCLSCPLREHAFCGALLGRPSADATVIDQPSWQDFKIVRANRSVVKRGDVNRYLYILCCGWAFRLFRLFDGQRQILNFLLPGDLFSAAAVFADRLSFTVDALTDVQISRFDRAEVVAQLGANPGILTKLSESCVTEQNAADELVTVLGRRTAEARIAYLFLRLATRIASGNVIREQRYSFALRQQHIADITGLTPVHVNRVLGAFRERGLIEVSRGVFKVLDPVELERVGCLK